MFGMKGFYISAVIILGRAIVPLALIIANGTWKYDVWAKMAR